MGRSGRACRSRGFGTWVRLGSGRCTTTGIRGVGSATRAAQRDPSDRRVTRRDRPRSDLHLLGLTSAARAGAGIAARSPALAGRSRSEIVEQQRADAVTTHLVLLRRRSVIETAASRRERPPRPSGVMAPSAAEQSGQGHRRCSSRSVSPVFAEVWRAQTAARAAATSSRCPELQRLVQ
jgi:hypothetical protein